MGAPQGPTPDPARVQAVADKLITGPIRYSQPGLQTHITYLAGMTSRVDQKVGRDAFHGTRCCGPSWTRSRQR